ncbi:MAG: YabP/YqfC family sporulation protein [Christensenellales bacterium]|jgi:sporulation protein YqfC
MPKKGFLSGISQKTGLPEDLLLDLPCMRMEGFDRLIVENHRGLSIFTQSLLRFRTKSGSVTLTGKNFCLDGIGMGKLVISGKIESMEFKREDGARSGELKEGKNGNKSKGGV